MWGVSCVLSLPGGWTVAPGPGDPASLAAVQPNLLALEHCCLWGHRESSGAGRGMLRLKLLLREPQQPPTPPHVSSEVPFRSDCLAQGGNLGSELGQNRGSRPGHGAPRTPAPVK